MLKINKDPDGGFAYERCCFCRETTKFWYIKKDVSVCEKCAVHATDNDVPAKRTWINRERIAGGESKIVPGEQHLEVEERDRWEYQAADLRGDSWDALGKRGWEIFHAAMDGAGVHWGYFKRVLR